MSAECHEDVTRRGESQPCNRVAVAMRIDQDGHHYPVCRTHVRHPMVPLLALVEKAEAEQRKRDAEVWKEGVLAMVADHWGHVDDEAMWDLVAEQSDWADASNPYREA